MGYRTVIAHGLALPPEYNYILGLGFTLVSYMFWQMFSLQGYNYYLRILYSRKLCGIILLTSKYHISTSVLNMSKCMAFLVLCSLAVLLRLSLLLCVPDTVALFSIAGNAMYRAPSVLLGPCTHGWLAYHSTLCRRPAVVHTLHACTKYRIHIS